MSENTKALGKPASYVLATQIFDKNIKYLEAVGVDASTLDACRKIVAFVKSRNATQAQEILAGREPRGKEPKLTDPDVTNEELKQLSPEEVKAMLTRDSLSRSFLERLAEARFGMTKGGLSVLRTRNALLEKLATLTQHEDTHEAIARAAHTSSPKSE